MEGLKQFKASLEAYLRGQASFGTVSTKLDEALAEAPEAAGVANKLLGQARDAGLPDHLYAVLHSQVEGAGSGLPQPPGPMPEEELEATVVLEAPIVDTDRTVLVTEQTDSDTTTAIAPAAPPSDASAAVDKDSPTQIGAALDEGKDAQTLLPEHPMDQDASTLLPEQDASQEAPTLMPAGPDDSPTTIVGQDELTVIADDRTASVEHTAFGAASSTTESVDLTDPGALDAAAADQAEADTGASWPTGTDWKAEPSATAPARKIGPGTVLKDRFELLSLLGEGGMGAVYKAVDKLKVEARDRNPYLAIKLLTGDFQSHPEAFIALQRESAKAQRLAHPNIATVYDFDRDRGTIYMTMELLEGDALNSYIRKLPAGGLPADQAMPLVEQLGAGLSYAHKHNLVHSDLKPGNCWLTRESTLKLLDFGIARASSTKADASGETTVFDPGQLGALTPAYATVEMFEGQDPDPRDDLYAMACIAYELLTGKHPFNKVSAPKALEKKLAPAPVAKLTKRQNKALMRGLALRREDRTPTVDEFLEEIRPRKDRTKQYIASGLVAAILVAVFAYTPIKTYFEDQRNAGIVAQIASGREDTIKAALATTRGLDERSRKAILEQAKDTLIKFYEGRAEAAVDSSKGHYDFPLAMTEIAKAKALYPDSATVLNIESDLESRKNRLLNDLTGRFNDLLDKGLLIPVKGQDDITDVLAIVQQAAPDSPLLKDERLAVRYGDLAEEAIRKKDYQGADAILQASLAYVPEDSRLTSLRFEVKQELRRQQDEVLVAEIQQRLISQKDSLKGLTDFLGVRDELVKLAELKPDSPLLAELRQSLKSAFGQELARATAAKSWDDAEKLLLGFAKLLDLPYIVEKRSSLSALEAAAGYQPMASAERASQAKQRQEAMAALLAEAKFTDAWETSLLLQYKELAAMLPAGDSWLKQTQARIAQIYIAQAHAMAKANRFTEALAYVQRGERFDPALGDFAATRQAIATAEADFRKQQAEKARMARLNGLKQTLLTQAKADKVLEARKSYDELKAGLDPKDPFLTKDGPQAIAQSYLRLAQGQASQGRFESALKLADAGLELAPDLQPLREASTAYGGEVRISQLRSSLGEARSLDVASVKRSLGEIQRMFPDRFPKLETDLAGVAAARIEALKKSDSAAAAAVLAAAKQIFPGSSTIKRIVPPRQPSQYAAKGEQAVAQHKLSQADQILAQAMRTESDHPDVLRFRSALEAAKQRADAAYQQAVQAQQTRRLPLAKSQIQEAIAFWSDNDRYQQKLAEINHQLKTGGRPCDPSLAGYGTAARATCYDMLAERQKGPLMVVVPAGGGSPKPFAIGKYEVSIGDYNAYCRLSHHCQPITGQDEALPATGISAKDAEAYAKWLSATTGNRYRLPTEKEWVYASTAKGVSADKDYNCRVQLGDQLLKGHALMNVRSGRPNAWGLHNFVGNAQEWVITPSGFAARGGDFEDSLSKCDISLSRSLPGSGDPVTGFRLVQDLG